MQLLPGRATIKESFQCGFRSRYAHDPKFFLVNYIDVWLHSMRRFPELSDLPCSTPRKDKGQQKPDRARIVESRVQELAFRAFRLGFRSNRIAHILRSCARPPQLDRPSAEVPEITCDWVNTAKKARCNRPSKASLERDRKHLFPEVVFQHHQSPAKMYITTYYVLQDIVRCFWGQEPLNLVNDPNRILEETRSEFFSDFPTIHPDNNQPTDTSMTDREPGAISTGQDENIGPNDQKPDQEESSDNDSVEGCFSERADRDREDAERVLLEQNEVELGELRQEIQRSKEDARQQQEKSDRVIGDLQQQVQSSENSLRLLQHELTVHTEEERNLRTQSSQHAENAERVRQEHESERMRLVQERDDKIGVLQQHIRDHENTTRVLQQAPNDRMENTHDLREPTSGISEADDAPQQAASVGQYRIGGEKASQRTEMGQESGKRMTMFPGSSPTLTQNERSVQNIASEQSEKSAPLQPTSSTRDQPSEKTPSRLQKVRSQAPPASSLPAGSTHPTISLPVPSTAQIERLYSRTEADDSTRVEESQVRHHKPASNLQQPSIGRYASEDPRSRPPETDSWLGKRRRPEGEAFEFKFKERRGYEITPIVESFYRLGIRDDPRVFVASYRAIEGLESRICPGNYGIHLWAWEQNQKDEFIREVKWQVSNRKLALSVVKQTEAPGDFQLRSIDPKTAWIALSPTSDKVLGILTDKQRHEKRPYASTDSERNRSQLRRQTERQELQQFGPFLLDTPMIDANSRPVAEPSACPDIEDEEL